MFKVLVVDDEADVREVLARMLEGQGYQVAQVANGPLALQMLACENFDLVITDLKMSPMSGLELLKLLRPTYPQTDVIMMTGFGSIESAIEAMRLGACDYITKPFLPDEFLSRVRSALEKAPRRQPPEPPGRVGSSVGLEAIIGESKEVMSMLEKIRQVAASESTVLITGETGTGKELVAKAIHTLSRRADYPFVSVNCAAFPEHLLESELFGHVKGAFTGATASRKGLIEEADGGTFFLDEVGAMPLHVQAKLLRVLEDRTIRRIGENKTITVDCRLIAATNQDLVAAIARREFREDLYYRLNVISIHVPPLRARRSDIPLLAQHFLKKFSQRERKAVHDIAPEAMHLLLAYDYPGNVRELQHILERAVTMCTTYLITADLLPPQVWHRVREQPEPATTTQPLPSATEGESRLAILAAREQELIRAAIARNQGNLEKAAKDLGISRVTLWRRMKKLNLK